MSTPPEDIDALFDLPPPVAPVQPASPLPGLPSTPLGDSRKELRVKVSWPARVQLPGGRVIELRVRDLSESGVGMLTEQHIPPAAVLNFVVAVPGLNDGSPMTPVSGTIRTTYVVVKGVDLFCGGTWVNLPSSGRDLIDKWIRKLRK
ncbi:MAG TPA: PilZ domain-containing protein [Burkholderiaceae bacterium]